MFQLFLFKTVVAGLIFIGISSDPAMAKTVAKTTKKATVATQPAESSTPVENPAVEEPKSDMFVEEPEPQEQIPELEKLDKKAKKQKELEEKQAKLEREIADQPQLLGKHYFLGLGYNLAPEVKFLDSEFTAAGVKKTGNTKFVTEPAMDISFGVMNSKAESFGGFATLTYQMMRKIRNVKQKTGGLITNSNFPGSKPSLQITLFEFGILYRFKHAYLPIGFNYSIPQYSGKVETGLKTKVSGGIGFQLGYGEVVTKNLIVEVLWKNVSVAANSSGGSTELDYGAGTLSNWTVQLRRGF